MFVFSAPNHVEKTNPLRDYVIAHMIMLHHVHMCYMYILYREIHEILLHDIMYIRDAYFF